MALEASDPQWRVDAPPGTRALAIHPGAITLAPGESQRCALLARDADGVTLRVAPRWSASRGRIDADGLFTAPAEPGPVTLRAKLGAQELTSEVTIAAEAATWPTAGWPTATPLEAGLDENELRRARDYALTGGGSGYITRGGKLVYSWGSATIRYDLKSTTKSIGGTLLGLALADGRVQLDARAQSYLPSFGVPPDSNASTGWLEEVTLRQLATQTSGDRWLCQAQSSRASSGLV